MLIENGIQFDSELLKLVDTNGDFVHKSICDTFISIADDSNITKLINNTLNEEEGLEIEIAIEKIAKSGGAIR